MSKFSKEQKELIEQLQRQHDEEPILSIVEVMQYLETGHQRNLEQLLSDFMINSITNIDGDIFPLIHGIRIIDNEVVFYIDSSLVNYNFDNALN